MTVLISGYPRTGTTWCRLVHYNYLNILEYDAKETLRHSELAWLRDHERRVVFTHLPFSGKKGKGFDFSSKELYNKHTTILYCERNPYDTLISNWHYLKDREVPFGLLNSYSDQEVKQFETLEGFTKYYLDVYIDHVQSTKPLATLILNYDKLISDNAPFYQALRLMCLDLGVEYSYDIATQVIELSSFENVRAMGDKYGEKDGLAGGLKGYFCRDGRSGQYKEVMSEELIEWITDKWSSIFKE